MAQNSNIEWTDSTWNPVTGCTKITAGCKNCYAERMANRLYEMGQPRYRNKFQLTLQEDLIDLPLKWKKPRIVFVNSMSDLFHKDVPFAFIQSVFDTMNLASQHVFQVLTKRSERLRELAPILHWSPNIWMGVSVENQGTVSRVSHLRDVPAKIRFLSVEPLIGPITNIDLTGIHWVIAGGESGPRARPMKPKWARDIRDLCIRQNVQFFFKQWGGVNKKKTGRKLDGKYWDQRPVYSPNRQEYLFT